LSELCVINVFHTVPEKFKGKNVFFELLRDHILIVSSKVQHQSKQAKLTHVWSQIWFCMVLCTNTFTIMTLLEIDTSHNCGPKILLVQLFLQW